MPIAAVHLHSDRPEVVEAAIRALGGIGTRRAEQLLREHLKPLYLRAQLNLDALDALQRMATAPDAPRRALEAWLIDSNRWIMRRALVVKSALGSPRDVKLLDALTRAREARTRSDAVEALVNLPTKRFIQPLVPLLEARADFSATPEANGRRQPVAAAADTELTLTLQKATADDPWARLLVARLLQHEDRGDGSPGDEAMLDLVLFLKTTPLFRAIPLEDIARIARLAEAVAAAEGEVLAEAEAPIRYVYVIRSGTVALRFNDRTVEVVGPGASFGESAVFGEDRHAVAFRAASPSLLLRFPISMIADLVAENPEMLGPLAFDLSTRLNRLRTTLAAAGGSA
ncbi:Crp/Fnr family transcriptional regulator [Defluviicoccus vanus]|uniref:Crp/Fnr family transcriptional regulator n=1 Tax=Defluviicoccus vanus TaxID=111831 RepID=A0A7H1MZ03_9PROT|nr:Crp/Fnr family transcriptional regulator [Defluviicoccus vanus]